MDDGTKQAVLAAVRTIFLAIGGGFVTKGWIDDATNQQIIGAVMVIIPAVWAIWDKRQVEQKTKDREVIAVNAGVAISNQTSGMTPAIAASEVPKVINEFKKGTTE